jgi:hypothetical protein
MSTRLVGLVLVALVTTLTGCVTVPKYDYTEFQAARPASILVLPPLNDAPDVKGGPAVWAGAVHPLSEAGYYVFPATLVDETFRQNGMTTAADIHQIAPPKLRDFFGADAALYLHIEKYGTSYALVASETRVTVTGKLIDLRTGKELWKGMATSSSAEGQGGNQGGLAGMLIGALVRQIIGVTTDAGYRYARITDERLLGAPRTNGLLYGPRAKTPWQVPAPPQNGQ